MTYNKIFPALVVLWLVLLFNLPLQRMLGVDFNTRHELHLVLFVLTLLITILAAFLPEKKGQ
jgi:hypothetical protein